VNAELIKLTKWLREQKRILENQNTYTDIEEEGGYARIDAIEETLDKIKLL